MFNNLGPTHPKAAEAPVDDVEGHRVAMFVEDQKDAAIGALPTTVDDATAADDGVDSITDDEGDDVQGAIMLD